MSLTRLRQTDLLVELALLQRLRLLGLTRLQEAEPLRRDDSQRSESGRSGRRSTTDPGRVPLTSDATGSTMVSLRNLTMTNFSSCCRFFLYVSLMPCSRRTTAETSNTPTGFYLRQNHLQLVSVGTVTLFNKDEARRSMRASRVTVTTVAHIIQKFRPMGQ